MPRRKKHKNLKFILIALALVVGGYIALDFYFGVYRNSRGKEGAPPDLPKIEENAKNAPPDLKEAPVPEIGKGFVLQSYRDNRYGFEFQYPVFSGNDPQCPILVQTDDGLSVGIFSFAVSNRQGSLADFSARQLDGMEINSHSDLLISGKPAVRVDYQTAGMGWPGSSTFIDSGKKFFEFGLLANESGESCGGVDGYEDLVYQSISATLKFSD